MHMFAKDTQCIFVGIYDEVNNTDPTIIMRKFQEPRDHPSRHEQ